MASQELDILVDVRKPTLKQECDRISRTALYHVVCPCAPESGCNEFIKCAVTELKVNSPGNALVARPYV